MIPHCSDDGRRTTGRLFRTFSGHSSESNFHTRRPPAWPAQSAFWPKHRALLAADDQDRGRLRVGRVPAQFPIKSGYRAGAGHRHGSHHPLTGGWLADEREVEAWLRRHAHVHLSGHVHEAASEHLRSGSGGELIRVTAGAPTAKNRRPACP